MTSPFEPNWSPTPEQLAAYADGELPSIIRKRIDAWLEHNPHARTEISELRKLRAIYDADLPPEPSAETWEAAFEHILAELPTAAQQAQQRRGAWRRTAALLAAAAVLLVAFGLWRVGNQEPAANLEDDVLLVATAAEIEIISIAGTDGTALVVGEPPVRGTLELLAPGEVTVTRIEPHERDNMLPELRQGRPMIWARLDTELDD